VRIPVSDAYLGRVVNALAQPIDGKGQIPASEFRLIEESACLVYAKLGLRLVFKTCHF